MTPEQAQLAAAIAALETQRTTLGDTVLQRATARCAHGWPACCTQRACNCAR